MIKTLKQTKAATKLIAVTAAIGIATAAMAYAPTDSIVGPDDAMAYTQHEQIISNGHGSINPSYLVIHETADPGATADNLMAYWRNNPNAYVVHYTMDLDGDTVYHAMADNRKAWHVGNGNAYTVGIELCHTTNKADFNEQWDEAVKWAGDYLNAKGWGIDRLLCHNDCRLKWGGTDHTDPLGYFESYGKSWSQFKAAVQAYMRTGEVSGSAGSTVGGSTSSGSSAGHSGTGFGGTYTVMASSLNIRTAPSTSAGIVGSYSRGGKVVLDDWYKIADGYVWGKYTAYSGNVRYVAVGKPTGGYDSSDYLVKGGNAGSSTSGAKSGGWYTVDVNTALNVRSGPSTNYRITGQLHDGYKLYVQSVSNGWAKYQAYTGTRYVSAQYLDAA
jgi:uncharacterized protein YgiM (DUF1202 family)